MPNALITGITGQDGAYLTQLLLKKNYRVIGTVRSASDHEHNTLTALKLQDQVQLIEADFMDMRSLARAVELAAPDEIYHLAAQTSVAASWERPVETGEITALGTARLVQVWREVKPGARFFQAASSEMYGKVAESPQTEATPFHPQSPYGAAKLYAYWIIVGCREIHAAHASCGILFNHESPLRPSNFVTRKVTQAVARIKQGLQNELIMGNLDVQRDWGFAGDYVRAMWHIMQQGEPDDYVIATGKVHSLREFVDLAFKCVGLNYQDYVRTDPAFFRPADPVALVGNPSKLASRTGWEPRVNLEQIVALMVEADIKRVLKQEELIDYTVED
ncbi:MAG: GDP-mannose 4,6-dehydratase [Abitibacteriaceae bacterium]|nr:GDP-mannose 4,6-dehydratase [Abditibacteriaceae bacterium]